MSSTCAGPRPDTSCQERPPGGGSVSESQVRGGETALQEDPLIPLSPETDFPLIVGKVSKSNDALV